jgi:hypothetical protein
MTKTVAAPSVQHILVACRTIRKAWSEGEGHRRQVLAARKQQRLLDLLFSKAGSSATRVA